MEIYPEDRYGWSELANTYRECNYFPDTATAQTIMSWDPSAKYNDPTVRFHLREKKWNDTEKKYSFEKMGKLDGNFFKQYGKVFDIDVMVESAITLPQWNRETAQEEAVDILPWEVIRLKAVSAKKIQDIAKSMMLSKGVEKVKFQRKNRTSGNMEEVEDLPRDWENTILDKMINRAFEMAVTGTWLDTKYTFAPVVDFKEPTQSQDEEIKVEDIPF